jgi:hypothetical protein
LFGTFPNHACATAPDEIASTHHVHKHGFFAVAGELSAARFAVVRIFVWDGDEAMAPAVLVTGVWIDCSGLGRVRFGCSIVGNVGDISKLGITRRLTAAEVDTFDVSLVEVDFKVGNGVAGRWELAPIVKVMMKYA